MKTKEVLDILLQNEGMTRYRLAKELGISESVLSRAYNGRSDPGFNDVSMWFSRLGYELVVKKRTGALLEKDYANINALGKMLTAVNTKNYDYFKIHSAVKNILEFHENSVDNIKVYFSPENIHCLEWRAFYCATIAYLYKLVNKRVPNFACAKDNRLKNAWSPSQAHRKSITEFDLTYKSYNILLPKGELQWI